MTTSTKVFKNTTKKDGSEFSLSSALHSSGIYGLAWIIWRFAFLSISPWVFPPGGRLQVLQNLFDATRASNTPMRLRFSFISICPIGRFTSIYKRCHGSRLGGLGLTFMSSNTLSTVCTITCIVLLWGFGAKPLYPVGAARDFERQGAALGQ